MVVSGKASTNVAAIIRQSSGLRLYSGSHEDNPPFRLRPKG